MATYPQGVSSFIPDYQPYEPDLNFTANVLQLKQTQYDQNWSKLNNIYGQIVNAPLSHSESAKRRANTLNAIDFDLKRVTGLDLSLDQNVHQATQIFRPFYEDQNLMKDMAFTKNAQHQKAIGEGKRSSTDEKIRAEYWDGGLRYIDEKIKDFQALPYDKLTTFGDVQYVPYVNVEKKAIELAEKLDYTIDISKPMGEWIIRERNGKQVIPRLQSVFYSTLGKDPMVQQMYGAQAYLKRKEYIYANMNNPEFGGDAAAAERQYLDNTLKMLETQTQVIKSGAQDDKKTNDNRIKRLEAQVKAGDNSAETASELERLKKANQINQDVVTDADNNLETVSSSRSKTLTTQGGSDLSFDDIENMRFRVDAVMASTLLQADLNQAAVDMAYKDYLLDYEANPFAVQRQKYLYDVDLLERRKQAQKEVEDHKAGLEKQKFIDAARLKSGLYYTDLDTGEVKIKPEFQGAHRLGILSDTDSTDPSKQQKLLDEAFTGSATIVKNNMRVVLEKMLNEGQLSVAQLRYILGDKVAAAGFDMKPFLEWLGKHAGEKNAPLPEDLRNRLMRMGHYTTGLEKEEEKTSEYQGLRTAGKGAGNIYGAEVKQQLISLALGNLDDVSPEYIKRMTTRLGTVINGMSADDRIRNDQSITKLNKSVYDLENYVDYKVEVRENNKKIRDEVVSKLKAQDFMYADAMFNDDNTMVTTHDEFIRNALALYGDDVELDNGMSWNGWANAVMTGMTGGFVVGSSALGAGAVPGTILGGVGAAVAYPTVGALEWAYNAMFGDDAESGGIRGTNHRFKNGAQSWTGHNYTISEEFEAMQHKYDELIKDSEIKTPAIGVQLKKIQGGGTGYVAEATGVYIMPGARGPEYNQWLQLQSIIDNNLDLQQPSVNNWVSFEGPKQKFDDIEVGTPDTNYEKFKTIYNDLKMTTATAKAGEDTEPERFEVGISPYASGEVGKSSIVIRMPKSFLDKYYNAKDESGSFLTGAEYQALLKNGFNIITDTRKLNQTTMYQNAYMTPEEVSIRRAGAEGKTYTSWNRPGYSVNYKYDESDLNNSGVIATKSFPVYYGPGVPYKMDQSYENVKLGSNIAYDRDRFFNEFALQLNASNRLQEQQYGTAGISE